jgi:anthraniloyl-CoA monooxygenase
VRVDILGAGPAGLYLAILLRRADPACEVTVTERNPPDATFGWGVVFSEDTMAALRDADHPTYTEIGDTFARWDSIDIHYRGQVLRSRGHSFSAIRRTLLLDILQRRCAELGVTLRFGVEVTDPSSFTGDLVVAADGVNSLLRRAHERRFGSRVVPQGCKYVWFGTDLVLDAFTFAFRQTSHGLFQAHAYPFDENRSTWIVECRSQAWQAAGLDTASKADSIAFCETVFAEELRGHRLLSNRSLWLDFQRVQNRHWHHGNVVLVGDAAHTAHFSIGSGTKLAMEDAIALATAIGREPDLESALVAYELERQPAVERLQQAADTSAGYFERTPAYTGLEPIPFAVNLLTRSGRVSHANLTLRDPAFGRAADAWFAGRGTLVAPPPAFIPLHLAGLTFPNRIATTGDTHASRRCGGAETATRMRVAVAGAGLVYAEPVAVEARGRVSWEMPVVGEAHGPDGVGGADGADRAGGVAGVGGVDWGALVARVHEDGALLAVPLGHAGARGSTRSAGRGVDLPLRGSRAWPLVAASALPYGPHGVTPAEASADDLTRVRDAFAAGAALLAEAGVDVLELDLAHGRLLAGFLSPLTNRRTDAYGQDRTRFPLEVVAAVRAVWPDERPLAVRLTVADWSPRGLTVDDGVATARALAQAGVDLVRVEAGQSVAEEQPRYRRGFLTELSDRVRNEAGVATVVGGHLTTLDEVNTAVAAARADLCLLELP